MTNEQIRQDFLDSAPHHLQQGTFRVEVEGLLKNPKTAPALLEIELDDSITNQFLFNLSSVEGMPHDALDDYINHLTDYLAGPEVVERDLRDPATPPLRWFALRINRATAHIRSMDPLGYSTETDK